MDTAGSLMLLSIILNCWAGILHNRRTTRLEVLNNLNARGDDRSNSQSHKPALGVPTSSVELRDVSGHLLVVEGKPLNNMQRVGAVPGSGYTENMEESGKLRVIDRGQLPIADQPLQPR